jgi:putative FmdB family regulatory protein
MPTYEYQCEGCLHRFEVFQSIKALPIEICPKCRAKVRRIISGGSALIFKGTGFYKTDYRSESYKKKAEAEKTKAEKPAYTKEVKEASSKKPHD